MIEDMLAYNREFVQSKGYEKFQTSKYPDKKIAILTCMDTRLVELLPAALGIRNGDVKMIKNAGGMITGPFDSAVRSLLVGIIELGVEEVMVIGHTDCGVAHINADMMIRHLIQRGVSQDHIDMMRYCGIDFEAWLRGFDCVENSVAETVDLLRNHPLMPADVTIRGYVINTETGAQTIFKTNNRESAGLPIFWKVCASLYRKSCFYHSLSGARLFQISIHFLRRAKAPREDIAGSRGAARRSGQTALRYERASAESTQRPGRAP